MLLVNQVKTNFLNAVLKNRKLTAECADSKTIIIDKLSSYLLPSLMLFALI